MMMMMMMMMMMNNRAWRSLEGRTIVISTAVVNHVFYIQMAVTNIGH